MRGAGGNRSVSAAQSPALNYSQMELILFVRGRIARLRRTKNILFVRIDRGKLGIDFSRRFPV